MAWKKRQMVVFNIALRISTMIHPCPGPSTGEVPGDFGGATAPPKVGLFIFPQKKATTWKIIPLGK